MKRIFIIMLLLTNCLMFGQLTKNIGSHTFENGTEIKEGMTIKMIKGSNPDKPGDYLWSFEGGSMPIPERHFNATDDQKQFVIEKVLSLKGMKNKDESIIVLFRDGKKKCYSFVSQSIQTKEVKIL